MVRFIYAPISRCRSKARPVEWVPWLCSLPECAVPACSPARRVRMASRWSVASVPTRRSNGRHEDLPAAVRRFATHCLNAILALAGGGALDRCVEMIRDGGRVAFPNGVEPEPKPLSAVTLGGYDAVSSAQELEKLGHAVEVAKLQVPIDFEYPLADASKAHARLTRVHVLGKIVLRIH
jgi:NADPH:quinone reductase-like Zn-dependent oxidoreductase